MAGLGFLSLGASAGLITGLLVLKARTSIGPGFLIVALMPIFLSGAAVFISPMLKDDKSSGLYAVGLLLSLMWQQVGPLLMRVAAQVTFGSVLIILYGFGTLILSILAMVAAFLV